MTAKIEDEGPCAFCGHGKMQEVQVQRKTKFSTKLPQLIVLICSICGQMGEVETKPNPKDE